tara:strand:- start:335 stop:499 length:165 start_codon:yes stop_codon:yes gene_type:complete
MGFLVTIPLILASYAGGVIFAWGPGLPWLIVPGVMVISLGVAVFFLQDPKEAEI